MHSAAIGKFAYPYEHLFLGRQGVDTGDPPGWRALYQEYRQSAARRNAAVNQEVLRKRLPKITFLVIERCPLKSRKCDMGGRNSEAMTGSLITLLVTSNLKLKVAINSGNDSVQRPPCPLG